MTHAIAPTPPTAFVSPRPAEAPTGSLIQVAAGESFSAALTAVVALDQDLNHVIELEAGATFTGNFELPEKTGTGWVTIRSSAWEDLPPAGVRVTVANAALMATLSTAAGAPVLAAEDPSSGWRFLGVEFTIAPAVTTLFHLVGVGLVNGGNSPHASLETIGRRFSFERCLFRPSADATSCLRALLLGAGDVRVVDSSIVAIHHSAFEAQGIECQDGPGPYLIENNYIEGAGENIMFGGGASSLGLIPSDIIIRRNHCFKPLSWQGGPWIVKNLFELKHAQRVLVEGNTFENVWTASQSGVAIVISINNGDGPVLDVTFQHNTVKNAVGFAFVWQDSTPANQKARIKIYNNLGLGISSHFVNPLLYDTTIDDLWIEHNTCVPVAGMVLLGTQTTAVHLNRFTVKNNLVGMGEFGPTTETHGAGASGWDIIAPDREFAQNMLLNLSSPHYGGALASGMIRRGTAAVEGLDVATGTLAAESPLKGIAV